MVLTAPALLVQADGALPLPWLQRALQEVLHKHRGHALLVQGSPGVGALAFAVVLAQSRLCEAGATPPSDTPIAGAAARTWRLACGQCASCRLVQAHVHPDLMVLMPETLRQLHAWPFSGDKPDGEESKKKPSRQIKIELVRTLLDWAHKTSARGRGKVVVLHPAEALNLPSASALLKTLEEPGPDTYLVLTVSDTSALLPTVRSRCQQFRLPTPAQTDGQVWLEGQGVEDGAALLAACSGRPLDALLLAQAGVDSIAWARLPRAVAQGHAAALAGWPVARALDALQKLCHDAMAQAAGAGSRFFPAASLPPVPAGTARSTLLAALGVWSAELARVARHAEHPWNEPLLLESLVIAGARALKGR
jgi:DNA polymerase III subunit delta'